MNPNYRDGLLMGTLTGIGTTIVALIISSLVAFVIYDGVMTTRAKVETTPKTDDAEEFRTTTKIILQGTKQCMLDEKIKYGAQKACDTCMRSLTDVVRKRHPDHTTDAFTLREVLRSHSRVWCDVVTTQERHQ